MQGGEERIYVELRELKKVVALVLAGGRGERLYPLTKDRAKPAVVFGRHYRIVDFSLSNCVNSGIRRIFVLTQYKAASLLRHLRLAWNLLPMEFGEFVEVVPAQQRYGESWYRGTADAIYQNLYLLEREECELVLILAGDHVYKMDYSRMLRAHLDSGAEITVAAIEVPLREAQRFGVLQVNEEGWIVDFQEKPRDPKPLPSRPDHALISMGIYLFRRDVLVRELLPAVGLENAWDFGHDLFPRLVGSRRVLAYRFIDENRREPAYWRDIGTLDAYYEASRDLVQVRPRLNLYDRNWPIRTYQPQLPPTKTVFAEAGEGARRGEVLDFLVSHGCIVSGGSVRRSILSPGVRVNSYAVVEDSVLLNHVEVGRHCRIRRAIIDKGCRILPGTTIGYDLEADRRRFTVTPEGVVVIPRGRLIGPREDIPLWEDPVAHFLSRA